MRILLAALRCEKGDLAGNLAAQLRLLADARSAGCDLALFPEMSLTGSGGVLCRHRHRGVRAGRACFGVAICAEAGFDAPFDDAAAGGAGLMLFPAAPGLDGRRTDEASWRRGFTWWEQSSLGDARRHARRLGLWIALAGQAGATIDEDFPGLAGLVAPNGSVTARLPDWREGVLVVDLP